MSVAITQGIRIEVKSRYAQEESSPQHGRWLFAYDVTISNQGEQTVRLLSRHWIIKDALGRSDEVQGAGVVGQSPRIEPGGSFTYSSWCPLPTDFGSMRGSYRFRRDDGSEFDAVIAAFTLATPAVLN
jgi:ApaG protein